jgi:cytoskeletal protein CcmA (bactofilin family)
MSLVNDGPTDFGAGSDGAAVIGPGVQFKGNLTAPRRVSIHGTFEGELRASTLMVGETGRVTGTIFVDEADVHGVVENALEVKRSLTVRSTGRLSGNISYSIISIQEGGIISGSLNKMSEDAVSIAPPPADAD